MSDSLEITLGGQRVRLRPGERVTHGMDDLYRDTPASSTARVLAAIRAGVPWREAVRTEHAESNPWLCDIITHPTRTRFLEEHPLSPGALVLDIGAGWGQAAIPLARSCQVVAVEPTPERIEFIEAVADQEQRRKNLYFLATSFLDVGLPPVFDYACCIGVLEWVAQFHRSGSPRDVQLDFLRRVRKTLRPGGRCYLGIENRLGLKYLLGSRDDHTALSLVNVFDAQLASAKYRATTGNELRVFTYSLAEYRELFQEAGFKQLTTFGAFPDYKLPQLILPVDQPEIFNRHLRSHAPPPEHDGIDGRPLGNQEELFSHYRSLAEMGIVQHFSPSFFFILE